MRKAQITGRITNPGLIEELLKVVSAEFTEYSFEVIDLSIYVCGPDCLGERERFWAFDTAYLTGLCVGYRTALN